MSQNQPEILAVRTAAKSRLLEIQSVDLRFSNGERRTYERLKPSGHHAVMMLPMQSARSAMN